MTEALNGHMKVWVDIATPPQALFFCPIVTRTKKYGHVVVITTRDFSQTAALADQLGFSHITIGHHGGDSLLGKGWVILKRALSLAAFARQHEFDLAVSHNSYAQVLAASFLRLPCATMMDYEHQPANHLAFRLADKLIVPEAFPDESLRRFGVSERCVERYAGVKEDIYLADFTPTSHFMEERGLPPDKVIATVRPPATMATYHNFENPLFERVVDYLLDHSEVFMVFLPRVPEQERRFRERQWDRVLIPQDAIDGPNLIYHSDLVISGGGTMNREAAVLGTPAYTVFKGPMAAVDRYLIESGRLQLVAEQEDISKISIQKKQRQTLDIGKPHLLDEIVDMILS